jgi:hypothetical protein
MSKKKENIKLLENSKWLVFLVLIFSGCGTGEVPFDLGLGYKLIYTPNSYFAIIDSNNLYIIDSHVTKFGFDSTFIVVEQLPIDSLCACNYECTKKSQNRDKDCKKELRNYHYRNYWIVNKLKKSEWDSISRKYTNVNGPFTYKEYLKTKLRLNCNAKLNKAFPSAYMHYINQGNTFSIISDYKIYQEYLDSLNQHLEK